MKTYTTPALEALGQVHTLTAADSATSPTDSVFDENGELIGTLTGSQDSCTYDPVTDECIANV